MPSSPFQSPLGLCRLSWRENLLTRFDLPGFSAEPGEPPSAPPAWIESLIEKVRLHLAGDMQDFASAPFDFSLVTPFQSRVYRAALAVPPGEIKTYGWLAHQLGRTAGSSRAIGQALGRNPWPLLVPCHRFVGSTGKLTGFSAPGGVATKRKLLDLELGAASLSSMAVSI